MDETTVGGPLFDDLTVGMVFAAAPEVTLTDGLAAVHQSIVGDRLRLPLSEPLARAITGKGRPAHPNLVSDIAIGQSTVATQRVRANLFYRGLVFHRQARIGDTLRTTTTVAALKHNRPRTDRPATGLAVLRISTVDQDDRTVLDFWRCAMIPLSSDEVHAGYDDDLSSAGRETDHADLIRSVTGWSVPTGPAPPPAGRRFRIESADVVSSAPELARATLNIAAVHHDAAEGPRLVYGGHTVGIAMSQVSRALPDVLTVLGWHSCDHLAPVYEGDRLRSRIEVERVSPIGMGGHVLTLRSQTTAERDASEATPVLDWRFAVLHP